MLKSELTALLDREMERREFLTYCTALLLTIFGITGIIRSLSNAPREADRLAGYFSGTEKPESYKVRNTGYGSTNYGTVSKG